MKMNFWKMSLKEEKSKFKLLSNRSFKLMRRIRDAFYINANFNEKYFIYYGMEFKEFIKYNPKNIENILVTEGNYIANNFNRNWFLETALLVVIRHHISI